MTPLTNYDKLSFLYDSTQQPVKPLEGRCLKKVKLSASHALLPKPMQSCAPVSVKCWDQDCISY